MLLQDSTPTMSAETTGNQTLPATLLKTRAIRAPRPIISGAMGMVLMLLIVFGAEALLPLDLKPSSAMGSFIGNSEASTLNNRLRSMQATVAAQNAEQARLQQTVEAYKYRLSVSLNYYGAAIQNLQAVSQAAAQAESTYEANRDNLAMQEQGGNVAMANLGSVLSAVGAAFGNSNLAEAGQRAAQNFSQEALGNLDSAHRTGMARAGGDIQKFRQGLPDLQQLTAILNQPPSPPSIAPAAAPPPPSAFYAQPAGQ